MQPLSDLEGALFSNQYFVGILCFCDLVAKNRYFKNSRLILKYDNNFGAT